MKIGIISDLHGDDIGLEHLKARLQDSDINLVICAGDVVERGRNDLAVINFLLEHAIPCVQGNHDENAVRHAELPIDPDAADSEGSNLSPESIEFLRQLPKMQSFEFEDTTLLLAHATPSSNGAPVFQDQTCTALAKKFKKDLARMDEDILVVGHTHFPFDITYKDKRILNPGSLCGLQSRDSQTYGVLDITAQSFQVFEVMTGKPYDFLALHF